MTADWPQIDSTVSLHASNDLFGGDIFGDELNDMYITGTSDIGTLQEAIPDKSNVVSTASPSDIEHPLDSIAFNDFTDLMPPDVVNVTPGASTESASEQITPNALTSNKRPASVLATVTPALKIQGSALTMNIQGKKPNCTITSNNVARNQAISVPVSKPNKTTPNNCNPNIPAKGKKNAQNTPNPLTGGKAQPNGGVASPLSAPGAVATPLPAPASFVNVPAPVPSSTCINMAVSNNKITAAANAAKSKVKIIGKTKTSRKTSTSTIYAPSRQMCAPSSAGQSKAVMKNMITSRSKNMNAIATAAAAASASPPDSSDFAAVAQAAVTNLMLNAGSQAGQILAQKNNVVSDDSDSDPASIQQRKIDTSTAHVTALTSPNWVAACASMTSTIPGTSVTAPVVTSSNLPALEISNNDNDDETPAAKRRRQNLNPEERAKQNRDRNREHARNTRLRKKAYVEELKRTLTELVAQRDATQLEQRRNAQRELEQREVRFRVMEEFLKLRGSNEPNVARWVAILEDGFTLTLPFTTYRSVVKGVDANAKLSRQQQGPQDQNNHNMNINDDKQVLYGAPELMADATALSGMLNQFNKGQNKISFQYECDRKRFLMDGTNAVLEWVAKSVNHDSSIAGFKVQGNMRASFSPASNKLISCELSFDTGPIISQLRKQCPPTYPIHDDFAANIFGGASTDADRLLDSLDMPMLPGQSSTMHRAVSQKSVSVEHDHDKVQA